MAISWIGCQSALNELEGAGGEFWEELVGGVEKYKLKEQLIESWSLKFALL